MRTVYCTSFPPWTTKEVLMGFFSEYGDIECFHIHNSARAFICFTDEGDAQNAIDRLNDMLLEGRHLTVKWAWSECRRRHAREGPTQSPTTSLFVFKFDVRHTKESDLLRHFERFGRVNNVSIRGDHAFVDFELKEDAERALENTHNRDFHGRLLSVNYSSGPSLRSPPQPMRESPDDNRYDFPSHSRAWRSPPQPRHWSPDYNRYDPQPSYSGAWRSPPQPRHWSPDYNRYGPQPSYSGAWRSPPQPRHWSPDYNRYDPPPSYSWRARRSRSPVYNRNDRLSYSRASSSVHRRYQSRSNARGSRN